MNDEHGLRVRQRSQHSDAGDGVSGGTASRIPVDGGAELGAEELLRDAARVKTGHWTESRSAWVLPVKRLFQRARIWERTNDKRPAGLGGHSAHLVHRGRRFPRLCEFAVVFEETLNFGVGSCHSCGTV